jgi:mannose-6-phosphate isomerase-like protein (cupin superfamily)
MRIEHADSTLSKGWYLGPWNAALEIAIGYANVGVDEPHLHRYVTEIYLVARGTAEIRIERQTVPLGAGQLLVVEPGEAHTFLSSTPDYMHYVLQIPGKTSPRAQRDKVSVARSRLGV